MSMSGGGGDMGRMEIASRSFFGRVRRKGEVRERELRVDFSCGVQKLMYMR